MHLVEITQCKKILDFKPCHPQRDSLPAIAWNLYLITGFDRAEGTAINITTPLPQLIRDCYPNLTLPEIARLCDSLSRLKQDYWSIDFEQILSNYSFKDHPELHEMFQILLLLPLELQNWISEKALAPRELYPLRTVARLHPHSQTGFVFDVFNNLRLRRASRAQAARVIELAVDLFLMEKDLWPKTGTSIDHWLQKLEDLRFPKTHDGDRRRAEQLKNISWPSKVKAKWVRKGDTAGIEVSFSVHNETELENFLKGLNSLGPQLRDKIWKDH